KKHNAGIVRAAADGTCLVNNTGALGQQSGDTSIPSHRVTHKFDDLIGTRSVDDFTPMNLLEKRSHLSGRRNVFLSRVKSLVSAGRGLSIDGVKPLAKLR